MQKGKSLKILFSVLLILSIAVSIVVPAMAQVYPPPGTHIPTYAFINVYPNPAGIGQTVTVNFFLSTPPENGAQGGVPTNMSVLVTYPDGTTKSLGNGNFTGDQTGGTFTTFTPTAVGNYTFKFVYGGQTLGGVRTATNYAALILDPSESKSVTLTVQEEPLVETSWPVTPLPTEYWQTPVSAENVQEWYKIMGPWLGLGANTFAQTGAYNSTSYTNPYTQSVNTGHVLWTKLWGAGGVAGGDLGGNQIDSSYWATRQYQPQYAPVVINGIMYSQFYPDDMGANMGNGIVATNLYTGQTMWTLNTTNPLRSGMVMSYKHINQYGAIGPFLWTTGTLPASDTGGQLIANSGTQWNMYDASTGMYVLSLVNGSAMTLRTDESGGLIGYFVNNTAGTEITHPTPGQNVLVTNTGPHLTCINFTMAIGQTGGSWQVGKNTVRAMNTGEMWSVPLPTNISGTAISPALSLSGITGNAVVLNSGWVHGAGTGGEMAGWLVMVSLDQNTGQVLYANNLTYSQGYKTLLPYTRTNSAFGEGKLFLVNEASYGVEAIDVRTGQLVWSKTFTGDNGAAPNIYDNFGLKHYIAGGKLITEGLGGDVWCQDVNTGDFLWYTNTTKLVGSPGIETPYGIWPLWVFNCAAFTNEVAYLPVGHEYNPPLFHGAQMIAVNLTDGSRVWSELGMYIRSTEISYGIMLSLNAYDNTVYAFGKGPTQTTIDAPQLGVTTATPVTITGSVLDISAGTKQGEIAARFPNGVPAVSDQSQSKYMEYLYQKQTQPYDTQGVQVTFTVVDANGNTRTIGSTTTNTMGTYGFTWTPDIAGQYTVMASFQGSQSYYKSQASTSFYAGEAATTQPTQVQQTGLATTTDLAMYMGIGIVVIIIAIAVVGMMILKKH